MIVLHRWLNPTRRGQCPLSSLDILVLLCLFTLVLARFLGKPMTVDSDPLGRPRLGVLGGILTADMSARKHHFESEISIKYSNIL